MDRRSFIALGATGTAATLAGFGRGIATARSHRFGPRAGLLWAADLSTATDSDGAGFGNVQVQYAGGDIQNDGPPIPVVDHPQLGRALKIHLEDGQTRWEAAPGAGDDCGEGDELFFRVDFALDQDFPIDGDNPFCCINQIHHGSGDGSPPVEFDVYGGTLSVCGNGNDYVKDIAPVSADTKYKLVYRVKFSADAENSLLEVWLNDKKVISNYQTACPTISGDNSYWKGASMYCADGLAPLTVYQNAHRVGSTFDAVNA